jgi:hypothetical protein
MGRVAKQYIVNFSRRHNYPDGSFAGVVSAPTAAISPRCWPGLAWGARNIVLRDEERDYHSLPLLPNQPSGQIGDKSISPELQRLLIQRRRAILITRPVVQMGINASLLTNVRTPIIVIAATAKK